MLSSKQASIVTAISLVILVILTAVMVAVLITFKLKKYDRFDKNDFIDHSSYQAVFLTNDQIYFGHLKNADSDYLILSDVHYVKINEDGKGQIVKLGVVEPHGPQDKMIINKGGVLYWENLKASSQVIETIKKLQTK